MTGAEWLFVLPCIAVIAVCFGLAFSDALRSQAATTAAATGRVESGPATRFPAPPSTT